MDSPSIAARISRAVVAAWTRGLAALSNCPGMNAPGVVATISRASSTAPSICRSAGVRTTSAP